VLIYVICGHIEKAGIKDPLITLIMDARDLRSAPAGGENPSGFHPFANPAPVLAGRSAAGRQNTVMRRLCFPSGRALPPLDGILPAGDDAR
jgi:hypothetical protein